MGQTKVSGNEAKTGLFSWFVPLELSLWPEAVFFSPFSSGG